MEKMDDQLLMEQMVGQAGQVPKEFQDFLESLELQDLKVQGETVHRE